MERRQLESKKGGSRKGGFKEEGAGGGEGAQQLHEELLAGGGDGDDKKRFPSATATSSTSSASAVRRGGGSGGGVSLPCCQAERCTADLTEAKRYHRRHKVCEAHAKAAVVVVAGLRQRFCQQCSRFHELSEFDEAKRSCRRRLAGHNERRRKASLESQGEGSNHCRSEDPSGRMQNTLPANPTYKHFQIS